MKTDWDNAVISEWHETGIRVPGNSKCRVVLERGTCMLRDGVLEEKGGEK